MVILLQQEETSTKERKGAEGVLKEGNSQSEEVANHLTTKSELEGGRPKCDITYPVVGREEGLNGESNIARDAITNADELQLSGRGRREAHPEEGVLELNEQIRRRGVAEAEIDGSETSGAPELVRNGPIKTAFGPVLRMPHLLLWRRQRRRQDWRFRISG